MNKETCRICIQQDSRDKAQPQDSRDKAQPQDSRDKAQPQDMRERAQPPNSRYKAQPPNSIQGEQERGEKAQPPQSCKERESQQEDNEAMELFKDSINIVIKRNLKPAPRSLTKHYIEDILKK